MKWTRETARGYIYAKPIFWVMFIIIFGLIYWIFSIHNFDTTPDLYFKCDMYQCENPFYNTDCRAKLTVLFFIPLYTSDDCKEQEEYAWVNEPILTQGEYGEEEPDYFLYRYIHLIAILIFFSALFFNHIIFNRGKKFDLEIPVTKKLIINRDWLERRLKDEKGKEESK